MSRMLAFAACVALSCAAAPVFAQTRPESRVVHFGDLNLDSAAGADTLIRRVELAADVVCGDRSGPQMLSEHASIRHCEVSTADQAIEDIGNPVVLGRYYGHTPEVVVDDSARDEAAPKDSYEVEPQQ
jgi:UrcA family protein